MSLCAKMIHGRRYPYPLFRCGNSAVKGSEFCGTHSLEAVERRKKKQREREAMMDEAIEKRSSVGMMAVADEHRKLLEEIHRSLVNELGEHKEALRLLADFERKVRLEEAEVIRNVDECIRSFKK